ncbi:MAG: hypothetical protein ACLFVW_06800 [Phycisphaerae bacterium]
MTGSHVTIWALWLGLLLLPLTAGVFAAESVATGRSMPRAARVWSYLGRGFAVAAAVCFATAGLLYVLG